jgi:hypothetical protein
MKTKSIRLAFEMDASSWSIPIAIWWDKGIFCIEIMCFGLIFGEENAPYRF